MAEEKLFFVELMPFIPHTVRSGKGHKNVKKNLCDAIKEKNGNDSIEQSKRLIEGRKVRVDVLFCLWKPPPNETNTRAKKDLDNLLKPVMDVLQAKLNTVDPDIGLGLIETDDLVYEITARKEIVDSDKEEGIRITIFGL